MTEIYSGILQSGAKLTVAADNDSYIVHVENGTNGTWVTRTRPHVPDRIRTKGVPPGTEGLWALPGAVLCLPKGMAAAICSAIDEWRAAQLTQEELEDRKRMRLQTAVYHVEDQIREAKSATKFDLADHLERTALVAARAALNAFDMTYPDAASRWAEAQQRKAEEERERRERLYRESLD